MHCNFPSLQSCLAERSIMTLLALWLAACATGDEASTVNTQSLTGKLTGTVSYRERMALPPDAVVLVVLADVSLQDVSAKTIARQTIEPSHQVPIPFEIEYDSSMIDPRMEYAVRATIIRGDAPLFVTDRTYHVITRGHPETANLMLVRSGGGAPVADVSLDNTRWLLRTLQDERVKLQPNQRAPFLQFSGGSARGYAGCNRFTGAYTLTGNALTFGNLASTMRACPDMALEDRFHRSLGAVERYEIRSTWLILYGADGELATFEAWYE